MAKKNLAQSATNIGNQAIIAQEDSPAGTFASTNEDDKQNPKKLISAWVDADAWEDLKDLAASYAGKSTAQLVNEAIVEYLERNRQDLEEWRQFQQRREARKKQREKK